MVYSYVGKHNITPMVSYLKKLKEIKNIIQYEDQESALEAIDELIDEIEMDKMIRNDDRFDDD